MSARANERVSEFGWIGGAVCAGITNIDARAPHPDIHPLAPPFHIGGSGRARRGHGDVAARHGAPALAVWRRGSFNTPWVPALAAIAVINPFAQHRP